MFGMAPKGSAAAGRPRPHVAGATASYQSLNRRLVGGEVLLASSVTRSSTR